jgi:hypothetical protein
MGKKNWLTGLILFTIIFSYTDNSHSELQQPRTISTASKQVNSAWVQPKGSLFNQIIYSYHSSDHKFTTLGLDTMGEVISLDSDNNKVSAPEFTAHTISYQGEYGITDHMTVFAKIPWIKTTYEQVQTYSGGDGPDGIGDIDLGIKYLITENLLGKGIISSVQGLLKIPKAYDYNDPVTSVSLGEGQYDVKFDVLFGKDWGRSYAILHAGYKYRFKNEEFNPVTFKPSDEIKVLVGGGVDINPKFTIRGTIDWTKSINNSEVSDELVFYSFITGGQVWHGDTVLIKDTLGIEQNILNLGIALQYDITNKTNATIAYNRDLKGFDFIGTKNAAQVSTFSLALSYLH